MNPHLDRERPRCGELTLGTHVVQTSPEDDALARRVFVEL
jgi:hypothetical protein